MGQSGIALPKNLCRGESMFKSIFAKYVSAFTAIVLCSFLMIILIISAIVGNYSEKAKAELMDNAAHTSAKYI